MYNRIVGVKITNIIWDDVNSGHIQKHNIGILEAENALKDKKKIFLASYNNRIIVLCKRKERMYSIVISAESEGRYYLVTARDMSKRERSYYREA